MCNYRVLFPAFSDRYSVLLFDVVLYALIVVASVLLLIGLAVYSQWLLLPWILLMLVDIVRGTISAIMIFFYSHVSGNPPR